MSKKTKQVKETEELTSILIPISVRDKLKLAAAREKIRLGDMTVQAITAHLNTLDCRHLVEEAGKDWKKIISKK